MSSYRERIANLNLDQLKDFKNVLQDAIAKKQAEEKCTVWQVINGPIIIENFRSEEYIKAIDCLAREAKKAHSIDGIEYSELEFSIEAERVPASEYEEWF